MSASTKQNSSAGSRRGRSKPSVVNDEPLVVTASFHEPTPMPQYMGTKATSTMRAHTSGRMTSEVGA